MNRRKELEIKCIKWDGYLIIALLEEPVSLVEKIQLSSTSRITGVELLLRSGEKQHRSLLTL
jgi:hypothetical protein